MDDNRSSFLNGETGTRKLTDTIEILKLLGRGGTSLCYLAKESGIRSASNVGRYLIVKEFYPTADITRYNRNPNTGVLMVSRQDQQQEALLQNCKEREIFITQKVCDLKYAGIENNNPYAFYSSPIPSEKLAGNIPDSQRDNQKKPTNYFRIETVHGKMLSELATEYMVKNRHGIPFTKAIELLDKLRKSLDYIHEAGYLHLDIKENNCYLQANGSNDTEGVLVLLDFGSAIERNMNNMTNDEVEICLQSLLHSTAASGTDGYASKNLTELAVKREMYELYNNGVHPKVFFPVLYSNDFHPDMNPKSGVYPSTHYLC